MARTSYVKRSTSETQIEVSLNLDGSGDQDIKTPIPFLDHMLSQLAKHGYFDLKVKARGDTHIDFHHTVEDVGIAIGQAFDKALGDRKSIARYGSSSVPFDETLSNSHIDLSGRPYFVFDVNLSNSKVGDFDVELAKEFFQSLTSNLKANIHIELKYGSNNHHIIESIFKSVGKSLDMATGLDLRSNSIPSTKGNL